MKAFVAFVVIVILAVGGLIGFWGWKKWTRIEDWGVGLALSSELKEGEIEGVEARYNQILDQDEILMKTVQAHNLKGFYGVASDEKAVEMLKEDTFVTIPNSRNMHILFKGKRSTRDEREAAIGTLSNDFVEQVTKMSGK